MDELARRYVEWEAGGYAAEDAAISVSLRSLHFVAAAAFSSLSGTHGMIHTWAGYMIQRQAYFNIV